MTAGQISSHVGVNSSFLSNIETKLTNQQIKKRQMDPLKENCRDKKYSKISQKKQYYANANPQLKSYHDAKNIKTHSLRSKRMQKTMKTYLNTSRTIRFQKNDFGLN